MFQTIGATCAKALRWGMNLLKFKAQEGAQSGWSRVSEPRVADSAGSDTWGSFIVTLLISGSARSLARAWVSVSFCLPQHLIQGLAGKVPQSPRPPGRQVPPLVLSRLCSPDFALTSICSGPRARQGCGRPVSLPLSSASEISFIRSVVFRPFAELWTVKGSSGTHLHK